MKWGKEEGLWTIKEGHEKRLTRYKISFTKGRGMGGGGKNMPDEKNEQIFLSRKGGAI